VLSVGGVGIFVIPIFHSRTYARSTNNKFGVMSNREKAPQGGKEHVSVYHHQLEEFVLDAFTKYAPSRWRPTTKQQQRLVCHQSR